jgi:hypothetical protein
LSWPSSVGSWLVIVSSNTSHNNQLSEV